jgi:hypothetical protein
LFPELRQELGKKGKLDRRYVTMAEPPQHVIRFYGNLQYALECIAFKQITFLHIDKLNDPFDPNISLGTDFDEDYQALINHVQQHHTSSLQEFKQILPKNNWESCVEGINDYFKNLCNSTFIFSTCAISEGKHPKDNLYMWSHYGNGHRGVAIEFDTTLLDRAVWEQQKKQGAANLELNKMLFEIKYQDELSKITCDDIFQYIMNYTKNADQEALEQTDLANKLRLNVSVKSMVWKTEKEWRFWWRNDETRLKVLRLDLLEDTIIAVYLGCRIADDIKDDFIFETKRHFPKAAIFKARKAKGKFALDFERIAAPS